MLILHSDCFNDIVHISAGEEGRIFTFHKSLLCNLAGFFKAALDGCFIEAERGMINMIEESPAVVQRFQLWAYTRLVLQDDESIEDAPWRHLIQLWLFADKYSIPDLQNAAIDALNLKRNAMYQLPTLELHRVYDNTNESSPLRRFLIAASAETGTLEGWFSAAARKASPDKFPPYFVMDLALHQYKVKKGSIQGLDWINLRCTFHVHPEAATESRQELPLEQRRTLEGEE